MFLYFRKILLTTIFSTKLKSKTHHNDIKKRSILIHEILKKVYDKNVYEEKIKPLQGKEFEELSKTLSSGIPIATPVFDGASVDDVTELLKLVYLNNTEFL